MDVVQSLPDDRRDQVFEFTKKLVEEFQYMLAKHNGAVQRKAREKHKQNKTKVKIERMKSKR